MMYKSNIDIFNSQNKLLRAWRQLINNLNQLHLTVYRRVVNKVSNIVDAIIQRDMFWNNH